MKALVRRIRNSKILNTATLAVALFFTFVPAALAEGEIIAVPVGVGAGGVVIWILYRAVGG